MKRWLLVLLGVVFSFSLSGELLPRKEKDKKNLLDLSLLKPVKIEKVERMKVVTLGNGLQAVLEEDHSAPVIALQVWVKAGSGDESDDLAGVAHLIEHMIFKGSEKFGIGELANQIESRGGEINAYTGTDYTVYHIVISSRFLELAIDLLSDSVFHPRFDPEELYREREVVLEEIRRQGDNPAIQVYQQLMSLTYQVYPYRRPVIGYEKTVAQFERQHLEKFFSCYYVPRNMLVVLTGDFDEESAISLLKDYFGKEKKERAVCANPRAVSEPDLSEFKLSLNPNKLERAYVNLAWKIPQFGHKDMPALDLLAVILGQGESSRLTEIIRDKKKLVDQIWAYSDTPVGPGVFVVGMSLEPEKLISATSEIFNELNRVKEFGVFDWELEKAKRQIESDSIFARQTMAGRARRLGFFAYLAQNPTYEKIYLEQIEKVSGEEIQKIAQKYLKDSQLALAGLIPEKSFNKELEQNLKKELLSQAVKKPEPRVAEKTFTISSAPLWPLPETDTKTQMVSEPKKIVLKNGIRLLVREDHYVPLVAVRAGFLGGVRFEDQNNNGIFNLIAEMLTEGTKNLSASEIHRRIESLAGTIAGFSGKNTFGVSMTIPSPNLKPGLELFSDIIINPRFPSEDLNRIKMLVLASLKREQDQPRILVRNLFLETLYTHHPYRFNPLGTEKTIKKFTSKDLQETYQRFATPENLVIAICGDVDTDKIKEQIEMLFGNWQGKAKSPKAPQAEPLFFEPKVREEERKAVQTQIMLGWLGTTVYAPDQPAMEVLTEILGGMSGRLFIELRDKKSLAYEVSASHLEGLETGYLAGYIGCAPEKKQEAIESMKQEFERLKSELISAQELERAKNSLIGSYEISLQNKMTIASYMLIDELLNLGFGHWQRYQERIQQVTAQQIQEIANKYITSGYTLVVINPVSEKTAEQE